MPAPVDGSFVIRGTVAQRYSNPVAFRVHRQRMWAKCRQGATTFRIIKSAMRCRPCSAETGSPHQRFTPPGRTPLRRWSTKGGLSGG